METALGVRHKAQGTGKRAKSVFLSEGFDLFHVLFLGIARIK